MANNSIRWWNIYELTNQTWDEVSFMITCNQIIKNCIETAKYSEIMIEITK